MDVLSIDVAQGSPPVLRVRGELDIATADQFRSALEQALSVNPRVVVDMGDVSFIDLSGMRVILEAAARRDGEGPLRLVHARRVARLLDLIGLDAEKTSVHICDGR